MVNWTERVQNPPFSTFPFNETSHWGATWRETFQTFYNKFVLDTFGDLLHVFPKNVSVGLKLNTETSMQPWDREPTKRPHTSLQVSLWTCYETFVFDWGFRWHPSTVTSWWTAVEFILIHHAQIDVSDVSARCFIRKTQCCCMQGLRLPPTHRAPIVSFVRLWRS